MKLFLLSLILSPSLALAYPCEIKITDSVVYYGQCFDKGDETIFKSCLDFNCKTNKSNAKKILKKDGCVKNPLKDKDLKDLVEKESSTISQCGKGL